MSVKGVGVDCIRFVCAVLFELYGRGTEQLPRLPQDAAMHDHDGAVSVLRAALRMFPSIQRVDGNEVEVGDILITAKPGCGPGHSMIVSARPNVLWHSANGRVHTVGFGVVGGSNQQYDPYRVYRMSDRFSWVTNGH